MKARRYVKICKFLMFASSGWKRTIYVICIIYICVLDPMEKQDNIEFDDLPVTEYLKHLHLESLRCLHRHTQHVLWSRCTWR